MTTQLTESRYKAMLVEIYSLCDSLRNSVIETYWEIGKRIVEVEQEGEGRATYGAGLMKRLAKDLSEVYGAGFSHTNLKNMRRFYVAHKNGCPADNLTWSNHVQLLSIKDRDKFEELEMQAVEKGVSRRELKEMIQRDEEELEEVLKSMIPSVAEGALVDKQPVELSCERGVLNVYEIVDRRKVECTSGNMVIDVGFNVWRTVPVPRGVREPHSQFIRVSERRGSVVLEEMVNPTQAERGLYSYPAQVERVIDGDTIWVAIQCGFNTIVREKVRLRGIDTPELSSDAGKRARDFVERRMRNTDMIVVKTYRTDKYDRYVADVFYMPRTTDPVCIAKHGKFLNQELLDHSLARMW